MKLFQSTLIAASLLLVGSVARAQSTFADVPDNHWAAAAVKTLAEAGIIEGFPAKSESSAKFSGAPKQSTLNTVETPDAWPDSALICPKVKTALAVNPSLFHTSINIDVVSKTSVTLSGRVQNAAQKQIAETIAKKQAPDYKIVNLLKIAPVRNSSKR